MEVYGLDIETEENVSEEDLKKEWVRKKQKEGKLALYAQYNKITKIGIWNEDKQLVFDEVYLFTEWLLSNPNAQFVLQGGWFDLFVLYQHGCDIDENRMLYDTKVLCHVNPNKPTEEFIKKYNKKREKLNEKIKGKKHRVGTPLSLKVLAPYHLGVEPFWEDPNNHTDDEYVLKDCKYTLLLARKVQKELAEAGQLAFAKKQMEIARMCYRMKKKGIKLDMERMSELKVKYRKKASELEMQLRDMWAAADEKRIAEIKEKLTKDSEEKCEKYIKNRIKNEDKVEGVRQRYKKQLEDKINAIEPLNINSDAQLLWVLKDYQGYECVDFKGKESTGIEVLEALAAQGHKDVKLLIEYRHAIKRVTSYFPAYEALSIEGRLHPTFDPTGTRTGRLSSSDPNLQQVPPDLKEIFKADEDEEFISFDAGAIEGKLIAFYSGDPELYKIIDEDISIHDYRTKHSFFPELTPEVKNHDYSEIKGKFPKQRFASKQVGFATFYGAGKNQVKGTLTREGFPITEETAQSLLDRDRKQFSEVTKFHRHITKIFESGQTVYNMFGRPLRIEKKKDCYMKGFNTLIQSSASDLCAIAALETEKWCNKNNIPARPTALVHDEDLFSSKKEYTEIVTERLIYEMTKYILETDLGRIPLTVEGGKNDRWQK